MPYMLVNYSEQFPADGPSLEEMASIKAETGDLAKNIVLTPIWNNA